MIKNNNAIIADEGKYLKVKNSNTFKKKVILGSEIILINNIPTVVTIKEEDVQEGIPVIIKDTKYFVTATSYEEAVTELIRTKYSLDFELALYANLRVNPDKYNAEEEEFQKWRTICKKTAKSLFNE